MPAKSRELPLRYCNEILLRGPVTYPRGHNPVDYWTRDIMIFVLVEKAVVHYQPDLKATRNPASKRSCACSLVAQARSPSTATGSASGSGANL